MWLKYRLSATLSQSIFWVFQEKDGENEQKLIHISLHESNSYSSAVKRWNIMREKKKYHQIFVCYYYDFVVVVKILVGAWSSFMCNKTPLANVWHTFYILKYHIHCVYVFFWSLWSFSIPLHFVAHACLYDTLISIASRFFSDSLNEKKKKHTVHLFSTLFTRVYNTSIVLHIRVQVR